MAETYFSAQLVGGTTLKYQAWLNTDVYTPSHINVTSAGVEIALATSTLQTSANTKLDTLIAKDFATQTTLAAILAAFKAEDAVAVSADLGIQALAVRADTAAATAANGDYVPLLVDAAGRLHIARPPLPTYADYSISSATGSSQSVLASNTAARSRVIINDSPYNWYFHPTGGTAAAGGTGCRTLAPGQEWEFSGTNAITGIGTATAKLTVLEA